MKAALSPTAYAALILKLVGALMVIGSIADCLLLMVPPNFLDQVWLSTLIRDWILRGTIPLMGFALLLFGSWIDTLAGTASPGRLGSKKKAAQARSTNGVVLLSLCYSILFMLLIPLYFNSSRLASATETRLMNEQAVQAEQELSGRLAERRDQIDLLLSDSSRRQELQAQLKDAENTDNPLRSQLSAEQRTELEQLLDLAQRVAKSPAVLEQELRQARQEGLKQIESQQQQERDRITAVTRKLRIHTIVTALILSVGYGTIAWTGINTSQQRQVRSRVQA